MLKPETILNRTVAFIGVFYSMRESPNPVLVKRSEGGLFQGPKSGEKGIKSSLQGHDVLETPDFDAHIFYVPWGVVFGFCCSK